jgi:mannosylglycerate hydrolase
LTVIVDVRHLRRIVSEAGASEQIAVVVPHVHWDREWYAPFEVMRFHLVRFMDELVDTLEAEPDLPVFLLDGQAVIVEDYLEVRRSQRDRVVALVRAGRLRPGPFYVQPDEFHVSGEGLVRNLLIGCRVSAELGRVMREGYLPDTFGHVHQLPQILRGFGITTFYAMRGFGQDVDETGSQFWWEAPDRSRVLVEWLSESYSNAAVLTGDAATMRLDHGALVRYDSLPELLDRLGRRSPTGVLLLLNGGDHLRVQSGVPEMVRALGKDVSAELTLGGLEEFHELVAERPPPERVETGEFRHGRRHDVFDGIASTRTPMKQRAERTESLLTTQAERLDALATLVDGRSSRDLLRHAWRELVKNYAHDSICGCSVDEVHAEMETRFGKVEQIATAVADDALDRLARSAAAGVDAPEIAVVVANPSGFARSGPVQVQVVPDLDAPLGERIFGWTQGEGSDWSGYRLLDRDNRRVPFTAVAGSDVAVTDPLDRRKEVRRDVIAFTAGDVPPLGTSLYRLVPATAEDPPVRPPAEPPGKSPRHLDNGTLRVDLAGDGTLSVTTLATGHRTTGLLELLDDGDDGDEYGFGPVGDDEPVSSRTANWQLGDVPGPHELLVHARLTVPTALAPDRRARAAGTTELPVTVRVTLFPGEDLVRIALTVDNRARDHRIRLRFPTRLGAGDTLAESAFGVVRRTGDPGDHPGWHEPPSGACAMRRFVTTENDEHGLQILTEGLHEYTCDAAGTVDVTLLRGVGWLARTEHPGRSHKIGPALPTPQAQCLGVHTFRLGLRPYRPDAGRGQLYRAAERFSTPLRGVAVQGERRPAHPARTGLTVEPADVVLSAVKTAEDGDGVVVRVFNSSDEPVTAQLQPRFYFCSARRCDLEERDLEERDLEELVVGPGGRIRFPLAGGQIATVRLATLDEEGAHR